jgi:hypothetical protein
MAETLKEKYNRTKTWYDSAKKLLQGRTIERVWWQEWDEDYPEEGGTGLVFSTDNGDVFYVGSDDEGNGPGALHIGMSEKRREQFRKEGLMQYCLPVGVESNKSYRDMWKKLNGLNNKSWNEAGHIIMEEK